MSHFVVMVIGDDAEKQIENERFLTENSQRINKNYR